MSMQDKIAKLNSGVKKRLFDHTIHLTGTNCKVLRLKETRGMFQELISSEVIDSDPIEVFLDLPPELPVSKLRTDVTSPIAKTESVYFYEVLPIDGYAKFSDNVEVDDLIFHVVKIDTTNYFFILKVAEMFGSFHAKQMTWKKFQCAPHTEALTQEHKVIINDWLEQEEADETLE